MPLRAQVLQSACPPTRDEATGEEELSGVHPEKTCQPGPRLEAKRHSWFRHRTLSSEQGPGVCCRGAGGGPCSASSGRHGLMSPSEETRSFPFAELHRRTTFCFLIFPVTCFQPAAQRGRRDPDRGEVSFFALGLCRVRFMSFAADFGFWPPGWDAAVCFRPERLGGESQPPPWLASS